MSLMDNVQVPEISCYGRITQALNIQDKFLEYAGLKDSRGNRRRSYDTATPLSRIEQMYLFKDFIRDSEFRWALG